MKRTHVEHPSIDVLDLELTKVNPILDRFSSHLVLRKADGRVLLMEAAALPQPLTP